MTSSMQARIIAQISKPPAQRNTHQLDVLLPWLRKKSELLRNLERNVLKEIVRNCDYLRGQPDDVIITQGDDGDRLFIILSGTVSVYVDGQKTGESGAAEERVLIQNVEQKVEVTPGTDDKPQHFGMVMKRESVITGADAIKEEGEEEATSSPEVDTKVAVQGKALKRSKYGRFVVKFESGKCFGEIALISRESKRNATIIADEECSFLVIKRYLYNTTLKAYQEQEYAERSAFVNTHPLFKGWHPKFLKLLEMSLIKETYSYDCSIVKQGDEWRGLYFIIKGNTKLTVEPSKHETQYPELKPFKSENDIFELELGRTPRHNQLEPLRRNEADRNRTKAADHIFVKRHEGYKAAEQRRLYRSIFLCNVGEGEMFGDIEVVCGLPTYHHSIVCTSDTEVYCLNSKNFERFITKKYSNALNSLRTHVETKLEIRSQSVQGTHVPLLRHLVFKMSEEIKPVTRDLPPLRGSKELPNRTILFEHLVEAFKANRAELCEPVLPGAIYLREIMREKARVRHERQKLKMDELKAKRRRKARAPVPEKPRTTKELKAALAKQRVAEEAREKEELLHEVRLREEEEMKRMERNTVNLKNFVVQFQDPVLLAQEGHNVNNNQAGERERTFVTELDEREDEVPSPSKIELDIMSVPEPRSRLRHAKGDRKTQSMLDFRTISQEDLAEEDEDKESVFGAVEREQAASRAESKMKFISELIRRGVEVPENPTYRDWETSDKSMRYLEERIKNFMAKTGDREEKPFQPRLSRFEGKDQVEKVPRPGGRVIVKPRTCAVRTHDESMGTLTNHEHHRYNMLPNIPNYDKLRKTKMLVQMSLDEKREKWLLQNSTN